MDPPGCTLNRPAERGTTEQKYQLVSYMEADPALCQSEYSQGMGASANKEKWMVIANMLNQIQHGSQKDWKKWKKFWNDQRNLVKKKASNVANYLLRGTGGGPPLDLLDYLNSYERRVLACSGGIKRVLGHLEVIDPLEVNPYVNKENVPWLSGFNSTRRLTNIDVAQQQHIRPFCAEPRRRSYPPVFADRLLAVNKNQNPIRPMTPSVDALDMYHPFEDQRVDEPDRTTSGNTIAPSVDQSYLAALPPQLREEVLNNLHLHQQQFNHNNSYPPAVANASKVLHMRHNPERQRTSPVGASSDVSEVCDPFEDPLVDMPDWTTLGNSNASSIDQSYLAALPQELREEVLNNLHLHQQQLNHRHSFPPLVNNHSPALDKNYNLMGPTTSSEFVLSGVSEACDPFEDEVVDMPDWTTLGNTNASSDQSDLAVHPQEMQKAVVDNLRPHQQQHNHRHSYPPAAASCSEALDTSYNPKRQRMSAMGMSSDAVDPCDSIEDQLVDYSDSSSSFIPMEESPSAEALAVSSLEVKAAKAAIPGPKECMEVLSTTKPCTSSKSSHHSSANDAIACNRIVQNAVVHASVMNPGMSGTGVSSAAAEMFNPMKGIPDAVRTRLPTINRTMKEKSQFVEAPQTVKNHLRVAHAPQSHGSKTGILTHSLVTGRPLNVNLEKLTISKPESKTVVLMHGAVAAKAAIPGPKECMKGSSTTKPCTSSTSSHHSSANDAIACNRIVQNAVVHASVMNPGMSGTGVSSAAAEMFNPIKGVPDAVRTRLLTINRTMKEKSQFVVAPQTVKNHLRVAHAPQSHGSKTGILTHSLVTGRPLNVNLEKPTISKPESKTVVLMHGAVAAKAAIPGPKECMKVSSATKPPVQMRTVNLNSIAHLLKRSYATPEARYAGHSVSVLKVVPLDSSTATDAKSSVTD